MERDIIRIKVVLAEKSATKWLAEQLGCAPTKVPKYEDVFSNIQAS